MPIAAIPAAISAGSSIISGILGRSAANSAAQQQAAADQAAIDQTKQAVSSGQQGISSATAGGQGTVTAANTNANQLLSDSAQQQRDLYQPYSQAGTSSVASLQQLAGDNGPLSKQFSFNPNDLQSDPGYQFTLKQGQDAIQRAAAAQGGLFSSGTLKSLAGYTTGTANQYFNDAYNRAANTFGINRQGALSQISTLQGLAGMGLNATSGTANAVNSTYGQQAQNTVGTGEFAANLGLQGAEANSNTGLQGAGLINQALTNKGNVQAAGTIGAANATSNAISGVGTSIQQLLAARKTANSGTSAGPQFV